MADLIQPDKWRIPGPYGTNEGDIWTADGSVVQEQLDTDGKGLVLIHEMMDRDGDLEEVMYVSDDAETIAAARRGTELYIAQKASES